MSVHVHGTLTHSPSEYHQTLALPTGFASSFRSVVFLVHWKLTAPTCVLWFWMCNTLTLLVHKPVECSAIWMNRVLAHSVHSYSGLTSELISLLDPHGINKTFASGVDELKSKRPSVFCSIAAEMKETASVWPLQKCTRVLPRLLRAYCMHCTWYFLVYFF